jgi:hypothetical protein
MLFLQEVDDRSEFYRTLEKLGYECLYHPKRFMYNFQGILLAFKAKKFDLIRFKTLEYSGDEHGWRSPEEIKGNNAIIMQVQRLLFKVT